MPLSSCDFCEYQYSESHLLVKAVKVKKLKVACGVFSALQPVGQLYPCPSEFPSFISRGATHHIGMRDLC